MKKFIIIDFQWFRFNKNNFIPKELASCTFDYKKSHFVFKPPLSFCSITRDDRRVARYTSAFYHGLNWIDGYTPCSVFDEIIKRLCVNIDVIYVKGRQKVDYLRNIVDKRIVDLVHADNIRRGEPSCAFHINNYAVCALLNCERLYDYISKQIT